MRLTGTTDPEAVAAHVAADTPALRAGETRADRLQRAIRIRTGRWDLTVAVRQDHPPATIEDGPDAPTIVLSGDRMPQPVSNYPAPEWDLLVQRVWLVHEAAHLEYTDFAVLSRRLEPIPDGYRPVASAIWNALEDAAIEAAIRRRWPNYGDWFETVRRNFLAAMGPGIPHPDGGQVYPLLQAAVLAIMDGTVIGEGPLGGLLDPADRSRRFYTAADRERFITAALPAIERAKAELRTAPEPAMRNDSAIACFEAIRPAIEAADADGRAQAAAWAGNFWGMPDDSRHEGEVGDAKPLPDVSIGGREGTGGRKTTTSGAQDRTGHTVLAAEPDQESNADQESGSDLPEEPQPDETERTEDLSEEIADQRRQVASTAERTETLQRLQEAVAATGTEIEQPGVVLPTDDPAPHEPTAAAAAADGKRLARVLQNRFQADRARSINRGQRRGRLDSTALHRSATGDRRVKKRLERPEEPEHHCLLVLDRSGSMREHVRVAEQAIGMLAVALEAVSVEVTVLELLDKEVRLAKPVDVGIERAAGRLYHGEVGGGTPLTDTLHVAREYLKRTSGNPFVIVVTDGRPADPDRYRTALNRFTVPVLGVNLTTEEAAGESEFHRQVTVPPETETLRRALRQLVQEVLFE